MQDVFAKALRAVPDGDEAALRWLYRVTTNQCISMLRRRRVRDAAAALLPRPAPASGDPVDRHLAAALLERCDRRTREVVVYYYIDGMTVDEVAEIAGLSRKTVGKRLASFRERARRWLER